MGKNNELRRNYSCICGKDYLSYPALYTHIKNKHNCSNEQIQNYVDKEKTYKPDTKGGRPPRQKQPQEGGSNFYEEVVSKNNKVYEEEDSVAINYLLLFLGEIETLTNLQSQDNNAKQYILDTFAEIQLDENQISNLQNLNEFEQLLQKFNLVHVKPQYPQS